MPVPAVLDTGSISSVIVLNSNNSAFLIVMNDQATSKYVIKVEQGRGKKPNPKTVEFSFTVAKVLADFGDSRLLTDKETAAFLDMPLFSPNKLDAGSKAALLAKAKAVYTNTSFELFILMEFHEGIEELGKAVGATNALAKANAVGLLEHLKDPDNLQRLGRIVAMDLFLGNLDRFSFVENFHLMGPNRNRPADDFFARAGGDQFYIKTSSDFGIISNPNNVVFRKRAVNGVPRWELVGFDPWDSLHSQACLDQKLSTINFGGDSGAWVGLLLLSDTNKRKVATLALTAIKKYLASPYDEVANGATVNKMLDLFMEPYEHEIQIDEVVGGIEAGTAEMKKLSVFRLKAKGANGIAPAPDGLKSRAKALRWMK